MYLAKIRKISIIQCFAFHEVAPARQNQCKHCFCSRLLATLVNSSIHQIIISIRRFVDSSNFCIFVPTMARIMAIDYGRKRVGVAVTDPMQIIAGGLATVPAHEIVAFIEKYVATEAVETIVVGLPKQMNNQPSESMRYIQPFVATLKKKLPNIPVVFYDERFTSVLAHRAMLDGGLKKKDRQNKALVDEISATIILQDYLESKRFI